MATETAAAAAQKRTAAKFQIGKVVSDKRNKTITVEVRRLVKHARYGKYLYRSTLYHAHDEKDEAKTGDTVEIRACRPLSKQKRWSLERILDKGDALDVQVKEVEIPKPAPKPVAPKPVKDASGSAEGAEAGKDQA